MRLKWVHIKNYRSCRDVRIDMCSMHALVGANGSGKSTILRALDFLFNPSKTKIDDEAFWCGCTESPIRVEALFGDLTDEELADDRLKPYLRSEGTFHIARWARLEAGGTDDDSTSTEGAVVIGQHYCKRVPRQLWLRESEINQKSIAEWWQDPDQLVASGVSFAEFLGTDGKKPKVGVWKSQASNFASQYLSENDFTETWIDNPQGYAGVLKGSLPYYVFVPAVRDVTEEAKVTKTNPFGRLLYAILEGITDEQRAELEASVGSLDRRLNRAGGEARLGSVTAIERRLNELLGSYMPCDLEIEFKPPTLETILTAPRILVDDGFRNVVSNKGHGLQRAVIFAILQCYAEQVTGHGAAKKKSMILAVEEPELYMHPMAQRTIRRVFSRIAAGGDQVVFSTHSAMLVDVAHFDEIVRVEFVADPTAADGRVESRTWQLPIKLMIDDLKARHPAASPTNESIRDLYSHAYHPSRSEGFFAKRIILVEGPTEQYALPIYAEACGIEVDALNIGIVDCGGKGQMDRLYRIFNELGIACYLLFDYDRTSTDLETIEKSKALLRLLGHDDSAPESIVIEPRFACFPENWEASLRECLEASPEAERLPNLTHEARAFFGLGANSGKPLVARYIARKHARRNPPFVPAPIAQILAKAKDVKWEGSCLGCTASASEE